MAEPQKKDLLQEVTDETRADARKLIEGSRSASLATLDPGTGHPMCSRTGLATDQQGRPVFLMSSLSGHHAALVSDPRASMLIGEPGSGDPLAYERISISGFAAQVVDETDRAAVREAYLAKHPKSKLYIDFKDFTFWRLNPERAGYVVGFGKAYLLSASDLDI